MSPLTLLSDAKRRAILGALDLLGEIPGDLAELGVYRGGVARMLATHCPARTVHLFDTFEGIPKDGFIAAIDGHFPGEFAAGLGEVREYLADCPNVTFHPGLFPQTARGLDQARFALVHLDADLYASTLAGLKWFWPRLHAGGAIVLDDYGWSFCRGVAQAVAEFFCFSGKAEARFVESAEYQLTVWKIEAASVSVVH